MAQSPSGPPKLNRRFLVLALVLIIFAGVCVYANSLGGQFVWDDETLVKDNPYIKSWNYLPKIFTSRLGSVVKEEGAFYRPMQIFTYLIDYSIGRLNVLGYHIVSMAWHILAALSVFGLIQILFRDGKLSLLTALLFVVHPVHTEAVSYVAGRADSLAAFFMFFSFILYLTHREKGGALVLTGMAASFILALLSKELSLVLPILVLFYHYVFKKPIDKKAFMILIGILVGFSLWRLLVIGSSSVAEGEAPTFFQRLPGVFISLASYFRLLLLPYDLHMEYGGLLFPYTQPQMYVGVVLLALIFFYVLGRKNRDPFLFFAAGWFFIALLPSSNLLFPINAYMAEHWLYLPSVGFFLVLARFLLSLYAQPKSKSLAVSMIVGLLVFYSVLTIRQNRYWSNGIDFYKRVLHYAPGSSRLYNNLAKAYHDAGKNEELIELLRSAIQLQPDNALAHNNLGNAYKEAGNFDAAARSYLEAIRIDPTHAGPYYNLSSLYSEMEGKEDEVIALLHKAIELSPHFSKAYNKLGLVYLEKGELDKTIELLTRSMNLNPDDPEVYHNFGYVYIQAGDNKKAKAMYKKALEVNPSYAQVYHDLSIIYYNEGDYRLAVEYCDRAVALGYTDPILIERLKAFR
ncbi:MAG: tetratricopeptide repeat protein [Candidatus Omnitrophica bacterium]|nr:tetratricopeptide repeat protein [Candidatus Omnitrophota bacterium]